MRETITFDDVLLEPQYSTIKSRKEVNLSSILGSKICSEVETNATNTATNTRLVERAIKYNIPIISSPMTTVTEEWMAMTMFNAGGLGIIHRYNTIENQARMVKSTAGHQIQKTGEAPIVAASIGATGDYLERAQELIKNGAGILCLDVAHGHHENVRVALTRLRETFTNVHLMAGNVATLMAFKDLENWGADSVRCGVGGGSICSTRLRTGHGVPTLQSVFDCASVARSAKVIADGGLKTSGDIVKALAAGADFVMLGSMLAGTNDTPGEIYEENGQQVKSYVGMASSEAQMAWRGHVSVSEGIAATVPYKGKTEDIIKKIVGGIRSGLSYTGARHLDELRAKARFIKQSPCSQRESDTHILYR